MIPSKSSPEGKSKQAIRVGLCACSRRCAWSIGADTHVCGQPWLANAREWLGVPYFIGMGPDWALLEQVNVSSAQPQIL